MPVCVGWCWTAPRELLMVDSWGTARVCGRSTVRISSSSFVSIVKCLCSFGNRTVWKCISSLPLTLLEEFSCRKWFTGKWRSDTGCRAGVQLGEASRLVKPFLFTLIPRETWELGRVIRACWGKTALCRLPVGRIVFCEGGSLWNPPSQNHLKLTAHFWKN